MTRCAIAALVVLAASAVSCTRSGGAQAAPPSRDIPTVAVAKVVRADLSNDVLLTAEFEPFQEIDVMSKVSGYVKDIKVDIGDRVREGQLLATLEIPEMQDDLMRAAATIDEAKADLVTANDELERIESAHQLAHLSYTRVLDVSKREPGLVPQQEVDEAHSRDLVSEAQVSAAKSHITASEQRIRVAEADRARYQTLYRYGQIAAPFTGVITKRYANSGALIQAGTASQTQAMPVVRLSENGLLRLALPVPESAVPLVHLGQSVEVRVSALRRSFPGRIARFADRLDPSTRTMKTEVDVPNPTLVLVPGMYAEVDLVTVERKHTLAVPTEAIDGSGDNARIYTVTRSGQVHIIPVRLGIETARRVEIQSDDALNPGDEVVVGPRSGISEGSTVRAKLVAADADPGTKS